MGGEPCSTKAQTIQAELLLLGNNRGGCIDGCRAWYRNTRGTDPDQVSIVAQAERPHRGERDGFSSFANSDTGPVAPSVTSTEHAAYVCRIAGAIKYGLGSSVTYVFTAAVVGDAHDV